MMFPEWAKIEIIDIINLMADRNFYPLFEKCEKSRLSIQDIERVLNDYGRTFVHFPSDAEGFIDAVKITNSAQSAWAVSTPLWTVEEGRSDLTLELTLTANGRDVSVELADLHVL